MGRETFAGTIPAFEQRTPFRPFAVVTESGSRYEIDHAEAILERDGWPYSPPLEAVDLSEAVKKSGWGAPLSCRICRSTEQARWRRERPLEVLHSIFDTRVERLNLSPSLNMHS